MNFQEFVQAFDHDDSAYKVHKTELHSIMVDIKKQHDFICDRLTFKQYKRWSAGGELCYFKRALSVKKYTKNKTILNAANRILEKEDRVLGLKLFIEQHYGV